MAVAFFRYSMAPTHISGIANVRDAPFLKKERGHG